MNNLPDLSVLDGLSPEEKALAMEILKEYSESGESEILEDLKYSDFEEIPVDIMTFISDERYLGRGLYLVDPFTGERKCTVFPYWIETLKDIFPDNLTTKYNTIILTGSIGLGKSFCAVIIQLYLLYRMMCLKDPYMYYGMQPLDKITFSMLNVTLEAASGVGWSKIQELLQSSDWFMEHGNMNASRTNPQWQPPKGIELIFGSSNRHVVGRALFCNFSDEVNFGIGNNVEKQKAKLKKMISQIDARMVSRFGKGTYLPTVNIIASSKDSEQAFMESYIEMKRQNESKTTLIVDEPQWVVRNDKGSPDDPGGFYVAVGNKFLAHELLPVGASEEMVDAYRAKGYSMLKVPPIYRESFEDNIDMALTDNAGISTSSSTKYISGIRLNQIKTDEYKNPFTKDVIEVGNAPDDITQYSNFFDLAQVNPKDMSRPLFIHLDMSLSGDKTGIGGVFVAGKKPPTEGQPPSKDLYYSLGFSVSVKAPKGHQISFEKNRQFIYWLRDQGFNIKGISTDTFQSVDTGQQLGAKGFNYSVISVDRVDTDHICKPYQYFRSTIYEERIEMYDSSLLTDELIGLERDNNSGKIDHSQAGINSKDTADAVCGAIWNASQNAEQFAFEYGEDIETTIEVSSGSGEYDRRQINIDFEQELMKTFGGELEQKISNKNESFLDFGMGKATAQFNSNYVSNGIIAW